jgi:hypothetical protein
VDAVEAMEAAEVLTELETVAEEEHIAEEDLRLWLSRSYFKVMLHVCGTDL